MTGSQERIVVAIDGPAGAGKSTVARRLAEALGFLHLNSGALYRGVTVLALRCGVPLDDESRLAALAREATMDFGPDGTFLLNGEDATEAIRSPEVNTAVSKISVFKGVRKAVTAHQHRIAERANVVIEGRDVTTVVFPDAPVKIYLDASVEERARRRHEELRALGKDVSLAQIEAEIRERDRRDSTREESPLLIAEDAIVVDTTAMTIEEVVERLAEIVRERVALDDVAEEA